MIENGRSQFTAEGVSNARDLGGLRLTDDRLTPRGVFFRSENVDRLSAAGWDAVQAAGVRTVVDLRQPVERARDTAPRPSWLTTAAVDLDGLENQELWKDYWDNGLSGTPLYYLPHLRAMPERAVAALSAVVDAPAGGVLIHCMGGGDRTGLVAMLLLTAVGAPADAVTADYLASFPPAAGSGDEDEAALWQRYGTSREAAFRAVLDELDLDSVLAAGGMTDASRAALRSWRGALPGA